MNLRLVSFDAWNRRAVRVHASGLPVFEVKNAKGGTIRLDPSVSEHRNVTVVGRDWIAVAPDGQTTLESFVHSPAIHLPKALNIYRGATGYELRVQTFSIFDRPAALIGGSPNYYHWLIDYLPRLMLLRELGLLRDRAILLNRHPTDFQCQALELLGVDPGRRVEVGDRDAVYATNLLVPTLMASTTVAHPTVVHWLREAFPARSKGGRKRIYLSRQDAASRRLLNEPELVELLQRFGFERCLPGSLTFQEQVDACAHAEALVAVHGAGLTNLVFCPPGAKIIEIFSPAHRVTSMKMLAHVSGHEHEFVPATAETFGPDGNPLLGDWRVDLDAMRAALSARFGNPA